MTDKEPTWADLCGLGEEYERERERILKERLEVSEALWELGNVPEPIYLPVIPKL